MVNRLWQHHFVRGIVATSGDFGRQGERPSHPELIDYLADEFAGRDDWSLKLMHRAMLASATYRQASSLALSAAAAQIDPDNKLLWRMPLRRIEAEILRDATLAASGELNLAMGGPSAYPELPKELSERYGWKPSPRAEDRRRRSIYLFVKRNMRLPLFDAFDAPDTHDTCCRREQTTKRPLDVRPRAGHGRSRRARSGWGCPSPDRRGLAANVCPPAVARRHRGRQGIPRRHDGPG
jgi:hypothetical protein